MHGRGACLDCCEAQPVTVQWHILSQLEHAFSSTGAMPRPSAAEACASAVPLRSLVAGEITWPGIFGMLHFADATPGESFLDCGAGHGRAVAAFSVAFGGRSCGVEIRPQLVQTAQHCLRKLRQSTVACIERGSASTKAEEAAPLTQADVLLGDMFAQGLDWCAYDIILVNATGFDDALMLRCSKKLMQQQPVEGPEWQHGRQGQRVLVLSQPLPSPCPAPVAQRVFKMSWGQCTVFLHRLGL